MRFQIFTALGPVKSDTMSPGLILKNLENIKEITLYTFEKTFGMFVSKT